MRNRRCGDQADDADCPQPVPERSSFLSRFDQKLTNTIAIRLGGEGLPERIHPIAQLHRKDIHFGFPARWR